MTHPCELCGEPATLRYVHGFQLVTCEGCRKLLMAPASWLPITESLHRQDLRSVVEGWRAVHT
jgi:hypothetical protein